jgi:hypothetical protein
VATGAAALSGADASSGAGAGVIGGTGTGGSGMDTLAANQARGGCVALHCSQYAVPPMPAISSSVAAANARPLRDGRPVSRSGFVSPGAIDQADQWDEIRLPNIATPRSRSMARAS